MSFKDAYEKVKNQIVEEDDKPKAKAGPAPQGPIAVVRPSEKATYYSSAVSPVLTPSAPSGGIYQDLKSKTNFDQTDVGKVIQSYLAPLAGVTMDEATRFSVAIKMAGHKDNLTSFVILATFDKLKETLKIESDCFNEGDNSFSKDILDDEHTLQQLADV